MANQRTVVAKCVLGGSLGDGSAPPEIWSTSFWVAAYGAGGPGESVDTMNTFDAASYLSSKVHPFASAIVARAPGWVTLKYLKCNLFGLTAGKIKQITDPTVELQDLAEHGGSTSSGNNPTFVTAVGWALGSTTGTRGVAVKGRMFLPPLLGAFTDNGTWDSASVAAWSTAFTPLWDSLATGDTAGGLNFLPSCVHVPKPGTGGTQFSVNAADITTLENNVWVMRSRKNALSSGGVRTLHPSFA